MKISSYISGFNLYLQTLNREGNANYNITNPMESVILYSDDFKDYINNKIGINVDSINVSDLVNMKYDGEKLIDKDDEIANGNTADEIVDENNSENNIENNEENQDFDVDFQNVVQEPIDPEDATILDFLNYFMEDETFKNAMDYDQNGELNQDDINNFLSGIKGLDEDSESLSLNDILLAAKSIKDGTFNIAQDGSVQILNADESDLAENDITETDSTESADSLASASPSKPTRSSGGGGGGSYGSSYDSFSTPEDTNPLAKMTESELEAELNSANSALTTKQQELSAIQNGTNSELSAEQNNVDTLYQAYLQAANEANPELAQVIQQVTEKDNEVSEAELELVSAETNLNICEAARSSAQSVLSNLLSKKDELKGQLNKSDVSEEQKSSINKKLSSIESEIANAQAKKKQAEDDYNNAIIKRDKAKEDKETKEKELEELNTKKTQLETQEELTPAYSEAKTAYETAKEALETKKSEMLDKKITEVAEAQNYVIEVQNALKDCRIKDDNKEFSPEPEYNEQIGKALAQMAASVAQDKNSVGMCLSGVSYSLRKFFKQKTALSDLPLAYLSVDKLRNDSFLKQHFKEVQVSRDDLEKLPAGAIVVWDRGAPNSSAAGKKAGHISIALGNGKEASDHIQNQMTKRQSQFFVFYPV